MAAAVAAAGGGTQTVTIAAPPQQSQVLCVKLREGKKKFVRWDVTAVDNEHMNKRSSKCCCIYTKPKAFGESSSEESADDDDCRHCERFHRHPHQHDNPEIPSKEES